MTIGRKGYLSAGLRTQECIARQTRIFWDANSSPNDTSRYQQNKKQEKFSWRPALQSRLWMKATRSHNLPSLHYLPLLNPITYYNIPLTDALAPHNLVIFLCGSVHSMRDGKLLVQAEPYLSSSLPVTSSQGIEGLTVTAMKKLTAWSDRGGKGECTSHHHVTHVLPASQPTCLSVRL
jgi:hypothetical protein